MEKLTSVISDGSDSEYTILSAFILPHRKKVIFLPTSTIFASS